MGKSERALASLHAAGAIIDARTMIDAERMLDDLADILDGMVFRCALDEHWTQFLLSGACERLTGYAPDEFLTTRSITYEQVIHPEDRKRVRDEVLAAIAKDGRYHVEYRIVTKDGVEKFVRERGAYLVDEFGDQMLEGFVEDISARRRARDALAHAEARYRSIFEHSSEGIFQSTAEGRFLNVNPALARMYGYETPADVIRELQDIGVQLYVEPSRRDAFQRVMADCDRVHDFEAQIRRRDGRVIWIRENARAVRDDAGKLLYYEGTVQDITAAKSYQEQLEHQANHDQLTGLPNRNLLNDRLQQAIVYARRNSYFSVVAFIDLDNFKYINDSLGHDAGDTLLLEISRRLKNCLRGDDTVARYGGDEFVLVLNNHYEVGSIVHVLERVIEEIKRPVRVAEKELFVTSSVGLAVFPQDGDEPQVLIKNADAAMYLAKTSGRNNYQFFTGKLNTLATERLNLEGCLRRAIERGELQVHYQPKMDRSGRAAGMEALLRWHSSELGWVPPDKIIGVAEETGLIEPITEFVLRSACEQAVRWEEQGYGELQMAVNLSARCLRKPGLVSHVENLLRTTGLDANRLELEITESMVIGNAPSVVETLHQIKGLGVLLAVDDFGTGYSSLAYLQRLPVDILKIDRSFVSVIDEHVAESPIARLIVLLGQNLRLRVVAEGVESQTQQRYFETIGCDEFQGYLHSRPAASGEIETFLQARAAT